MTTLRRTFSVGVSWPPASVKSSSRIANLLIASARDTAWLVSSTAAWMLTERQAKLAQLQRWHRAVEHNGGRA